MTPEQTKEMKLKREKRTLIKDLMKEYGLSKATVYRYLNTKDSTSAK